MNDMTQNQNLPAAVASFFNAADLDGDLFNGVSEGFSVVSIRGSKWRIKSGGEETLVTNADGDFSPSLEAVIVKASRNVSKMYYATKYVEGDDAAPTCVSSDGIAPDPGCEEPQSPTCAACKHAVWGSRITEGGKEAKACQDSRRIAVVPADDIANAQYGGVMLLRVPAMSLKDLATYGRAMAAKGYPYNAVVTRLGFAGDASYPKLTFRAVRALTTAEMEQVAAVGTDPGKLDAVLHSGAPVSAAKAAVPVPEQTVNTEFEQPAAAPVAPAPVAPAPAKRKRRTKAEMDAARAAEEAAKAQAATPAVVPKPAAVEPEPVLAAPPAAPQAAAAGDDLDAQLDAALAGLNGL